MLSAAAARRSWRKINARSSTTLMTAEFLHRLYQRHNPFVNPFRFGNTCVVFTPWQAAAYAPSAEWDRLAVRFGGRLLRDPGPICAELDAAFDSSRPRSRALASRLESTVLAALDDAALADLLVDLHHVPLGEIYEINLVQVEHALHAAARALLERRMGGSAVDRTLATWTQSALPTVASQADQPFLDLLLRCQAEGLADPSAVREELSELVEAYAEIGAAYGAQTVSLEGMEHRFRQFIRLPEPELLRRLGSNAAAQRIDDASLDHDPALSRLLRLQRRTGEVRDRNKRLLGQITRHRLPALEEVSRRRPVPLADLRLYLLEEVLELLEDGAVVPSRVVERRRTEGVVFRRTEEVCWLGRDTLPVALTEPGPEARGREPAALRGMCASPGRHVGPARVITSAADLGRIGLGDVLVVPGTDFDLIPLLRMAGAIVSEEGGLLSHAAVIARELGIPCLLDVVDATRLVPDGKPVTVDANEGLLTLSDGAGVAPSRGRPPVVGRPRERLLVPITEGLPVEEVGRKAAGLRWLLELRMPAVEPAVVVPSGVCARLASSLARGDHALARQVAEAVVERFPGGLLTLRSSALLEDMEEASGAGVYHSEVGLEPIPDVVVPALLRVAGSRVAAPARTYHELGGRSCDAPLAILVTRYVSFGCQGTAVSRSPWDPARVAIEHFESDGTGGCPVRGGSVVHFDRAGLASYAVPAEIPHLANDLARVAAMAVHLEGHRGGPVEVEWGLDGHDIVLLQVRSFDPSPRPTSISGLGQS